MKKVYMESVKKWGIGGGISIGTMVGLIFLYLSLSGAITITGYSEDSVCAGTIQDPCYAIINFTANEDIFIYPTGYDPWGRNTTFEFQPGVESWRLERSWGTGWREIDLNTNCKGTWCGAPDNTGKTTYSIAFRKDKNYTVRITAYKNSPYDDVKWSVDYNNKEYLDPEWKSPYENIYTEKSETHCIDGICNKIIYSGTRFVEEDNQWKKVENAKSLKGSGIECFVNSDGENIVECVDWNMTSITLKLSKKSSGESPIRIYSINESKSLETGNKEFYEKEKKDYSFKNDLFKDKKEIIINAKYGELIHFGESSSTIILQDNETDNLDDTFLWEGYPSLIHGDKYLFDVSESGDSELCDALEDILMIKFNLSSFDTDFTIYDASLNTYSFNTWSNQSAENGYSINTSYLDYGVGWEEMAINYNTRPDLADYSGNFMNQKIYMGDDFPVNEWESFNITAGVDLFVSEGYDNLTIVRHVDEVFGYPITYTGGDCPGGSDVMRYYTKEYTVDVSKRPYLNITYYDPHETNPPTYSNPGHNTTYIEFPVKFSLLVDDDFGLENNGYFIFSTNNTGTWVNDSAVNFTSTPQWANVTKTLNETIGMVVGYRWYLWDNAGNMNQTPIYELTTEEPIYIEITDPTTGNPKAVNSSDNISINFNFISYGSNITTGVGIEEVWIGGSKAGIVNYTIAPTSGKDTIGNQTIGGSVGYYVNNYQVASHVVANNSGRVNYTTAYLDVTATNNCKMGVYTNATTEYLIEESVEVSVTSTGWWNFSFTEDVNLVAGNGYFIAIFCNGASDEDKVRYFATAGYKWAYGSATYDTWRTGMTNAINREHSMYAVVDWSDAGGTFDEFGYITDVGWQVNVTVPEFSGGLKDLFINLTYSENTKEKTEIGAIDYGFEGSADINYSVALPLEILRFLNCSPDWENADSRPDGQTSTISAINATNNGTATGNFQINLTGILNTGWTLFASNDSLVHNLTLSTTAQTIWSDVAVDETKQIWLKANCSYVSANPGQSIAMWVG